MKRKKINPLRVAAAPLLMLGGCAGLVVAVRATGSIPLALVAGIPFTLVPASVYEWLVHRYVYHREQAGPLAQIYRIYHRGYHAAIFPTWR